MLKGFFAKLLAGEETSLNQKEAPLALAVLLVRVARSDGDYAQAERALIDQLLMQHFQQGESLRHEAEEIEAKGLDTVSYTKALKAHVPLEERLWVIEALWAIVLADGARDHEEDSHLRLIASLLGINDRDSHLARQRVQGG